MSNNNKTILLINHYAGSPEMGMEFRPYYLAKEWVKMGYKVYILAADYSHLRRNNPQNKTDLNQDSIDGINYIWIHTCKYEGNGIKRAFSMAQFVTKLILNANKIVSKISPDVVITSSTYPLDTYPGQLIKKLSRKPVTLVHEVHDMWPITPMELYGLSKWHPFVIVLQLAENSFCNNSDFVVSLLPYAKGYLMHHGLSPEKFIHIPNGIVVSEWETPNPISTELKSAIDELKSKCKCVVGYFGSMTKSYAIDYLIEAIKKEPDVGLVLVGEGPQKEQLKAIATDCHRIKFFPSIPKSVIPSFIKEIDISYVGALNNAMFDFGICMNKLFDAMMGGKPILYAVNAPNNYIHDYNCGLSVKSESVEALSEGLKQLLEMSESEMCALGENGHEAIVNNFTYDILAKDFVTSVMTESVD